MRGKVDGEARLRYSWSTTDYSNRYQYAVEHRSEYCHYLSEDDDDDRKDDKTSFFEVQGRDVVAAVPAVYRVG